MRCSVVRRWCPRACTFHDLAANSASARAAKKNATLARAVMLGVLPEFAQEGAAALASIFEGLRQFPIHTAQQVSVPRDCVAQRLDQLRVGVRGVGDVGAVSAQDELCDAKLRQAVVV